jgi:regulator of sirC expression with transglutaminase-like and TPR domain
MRASLLAGARIMVILLWLGAAGQAQAATPASGHPTIRALREVLDMPEGQIDFATAKVTIDRLVDPTIDAQSTLAQVETMAQRVKAMLPFAASVEQRYEALRTYLYEPGPWNRGQVFSYNLDDPTGTHIADKLLANYIRTRRGNCVSMPFLYLAIAQRLGLTVGAAMAPMHTFVKLRDDKGVWQNIETTSGGLRRRDILYQQDHPMTQEALANGIYMRPLSKRETVAAMAVVVAEHYSEKMNPDMVIAVADLLIERNPKDVNALMHKGYAFVTLLRQRFLNKYTRLRDIPPDERHEYLKLRANADHWYDKAEALGWRLPSKETEARNQTTVKRAAAGSNK